MKSYIYVIKCLTNGKEYVGKSNNPEKRKWEHFYRRKKEEKKQVIHNAIEKYGIENFTFEVILECDSEESAFEAERIVILEKRHAGIELYNMNDGGVGGCNPSLESRNKISESRKGMKFSEETRKKISEASKKAWNESSDERKERYAQSKRDWWENLSNEEKHKRIEKIRVANIGKSKTVDEETRKKISETLKRRGEGKTKACEQIEEYEVSCTDCGQQIVRKKPKTFAPQSKAPCCKACRAIRTWEKRRITQNIEPRYDNTECTNCQKELPPKNIKISEQRTCTTCGRKRMWERRKASKDVPCD